MLGAIAAPAAIKPEAIKAALDSPAGVEFSAPGNFGGSNDSIVVGKQNAVPKSREHFEDQKFPAITGGSCLYIAKPTAAGYADMVNLRKRNYFIVTIRGEGELSFNYRTSLDSQTDERFVVYIYNGDNSQQLYAENENKPEDPNPMADDKIKAYLEKVSDTGTWLKRYKEDGQYVYDISSEDWWQEGSIPFTDSNPDAYTRRLVFALFGPASLDSWGNKLEIDTDQRDKEVLDGRVYLDNFVWSPSETQPDIVRFEPAGGTQFQTTQTILLQSDYASGVFSFHYTLDGRTPTKNSPLYDREKGITISQDTRITVAAYENPTDSNYGYDSSRPVKIFTADYSFAIPAPAVAMTPGADFSDETTFAISGEYYDPVQYKYTLDGSMPGKDNGIAIENGQLTLPNADLDGRTLRIAACSDILTSGAVELPLARAASPQVSFILDGTPAGDSYCVFTDRVSWEAAAGVKLRPEGVAVLTDDGDVEYFAPGGGTLLPSKPVKRSFVKADQPLPVSPRDITGSETLPDTWVLYAVPKEITVADGRKLASWLKPRGYDSGARTYRQMDCIENGRAYWIHPQEIDWSAAPSVKCTGRTPEPQDGLLSNANGSDDAGGYRWEGGRFVPVGGGYSGPVIRK